MVAFFPCGTPLAKEDGIQLQVPNAPGPRLKKAAPRLVEGKSILNQTPGNIKKNTMKKLIAILALITGFSFFAPVETQARTYGNGIVTLSIGSNHYRHSSYRPRTSRHYHHSRHRYHHDNGNHYGHYKKYKKQKRSYGHHYRSYHRRR